MARETDDLATGGLTTSGRLLHYGAVWLAIGVVVALVNRAVDAPLFSPDSRGYLDAARDPFHFGAWHPPLFPIVVWALGGAGLGPFGVITLLGTKLTWLVYVLFDWRGSRRTAVAATLLLLVSPTWIMLRATFWSELLFVLLLLLIGFVLDRHEWRFTWRLVMAIALWLLSIEARYAGLFVVPGVVLGLSVVPAADGWRFRWPRFVAAGVACGMAWGGANMLKTGSPVRQGSSALQCVSLAASFNALPYCQWLPDNALCRLDPERRWLNMPPRDAQRLTDLQFSPESPVTRLMDQQTEAGLCRATNEFVRYAAVHHPVAMAGIVFGRVLPFLGRWETTEQWPGLDARKGPGFQRLEGWLAAERFWQPIYVVLFAACLLALIVPRFWSPACLYFFAGGFGHALGIVAANPFMALRYMAVTKIMLLLACGILLGGARARARPRAGGE